MQYAACKGQMQSACGWQKGLTENRWFECFHVTLAHTAGQDKVGSARCRAEPYQLSSETQLASLVLSLIIQSTLDIKLLELV